MLNCLRAVSCAMSACESLHCLVDEYWRLQNPPVVKCMAYRLSIFDSGALNPVMDHMRPSAFGQLIREFGQVYN